MIKKLLLALITGIGITIFFAQRDPWVKAQCGAVLKAAFEDALDCNGDFTVHEINIFSPSILLEDIQVSARGEDAAWGWKSRQAQFSFSWFHFFTSGNLDARVTFDNLEATSLVHDMQPVILRQHITPFFNDVSLGIPLFLKELVFNDARIILSDAQTKRIAQCVWDSRGKKMGQTFRAHVRIGDLYGERDDSILVEHGAGTLQLDITPTSSQFNIGVQADIHADVPCLGQESQTCFLVGKWQGMAGSCIIKNKDRSFILDPINIEVMDSGLYVAAKGQTLMSHIAKILAPGSRYNQLGGTGTFHLKGVLDRECSTLHGHGAINAITYNGVKLFDHLSLSCSKKEDTIQAGVVIGGTSLELAGAWHWRLDSGTGSISLANSTRCSLPIAKQWVIEPNELNLHVEVDDTFTGTGSYSCVARHATLQERKVLTGDFKIDEKKIAAWGVLDSAIYTLTCALSPHVRLTQMHCQGANQQSPLISLITADEEGKKFKATLDFPFMRQLLRNATGYDIQGEGSFDIQGKVDKDRLDFAIHLRDGTIRLPETYNFISGFDAKVYVDLEHKKVYVSDMVCSLHKGKLRSTQAVIHINDDFKSTFIHAPVTVESCLLNLKKDLFAVVSGYAVLTQSSLTHPPLMKANLFIERSQLKENIFSDVFQKKLFQSTGAVFGSRGRDMVCDISIETQQPVRIDTAFLQGLARLELKIKNSIRNPQVTGSVDLLAGSLAFPYKSLQITKGCIQFMPHKLYDPIVQLFAKDKIKKHHVSLQVTGSLQNHHIMLESSPPLTEEQIIALLLVGSEQESLNIVMPALIMQNLTSILFDADQSPIKLDAQFKSLLKSLKHIRLVPSFTDQTGRGGLRGAIEIEVNDRWRAMIQKNFNLTEDTRVELEYSLSDDISVRGIRDERRDVGGEVEMRWKF